MANGLKQIVARLQGILDSALVAVQVAVSSVPKMEKRGAVSCGGADYVREVGIKLRKAIEGAEFEVRNAELFMRGSV